MTASLAVIVIEGQRHEIGQMTQSMLAQKIDVQTSATVNGGWTKSECG
jgi:hypothetical protein